jgi:cytochrome c-type biogenesis protein CcmF
MVLVALAFELSVFGTFLTRSGVIESIHSFARSSIGAWFLGFVIATTLFSLALILWRLPLLRARTKLESPLSREATFLYNNLLLVALCLTIFWGEIWPIIAQLVNGTQQTMGRPYYDFFLRIFGLPLLLLMGIGPLVAWRRTSGRALLKTLRWPLGVAAITGAVLIVLGAGSSLPGLIAYTFSAFVLATIVVELVRGTRATGSLVQLVSRNRRRYGGYIVHASIVLLAIGIVGSSAYQTQREFQVRKGQTFSMPGYKAKFLGLTSTRSVTDTGSSVETRALLSVNGRYDGTMTSSQVNSSALGISHEVGIHTDWLRAEDYYVILDQIAGNTVYFKVFVKPLVNLIWVAGFVFLGGSLIAMWPDAREQRRLVARLSLARA